MANNAELNLHIIPFLYTCFIHTCAVCTAILDIQSWLVYSHGVSYITCKSVPLNYMETVGAKVKIISLLGN